MTQEIACYLLRAEKYLVMREIRLKNNSAALRTKGNYIAFTE